MYKLFLCLRYLRCRVLAYFAVFGVVLCVFMMLVSISVMSGFLWKIEVAAKGLFGDIVIEPASLSGLGRYDQAIDAIKSKIPAVRGASPFILTYGIICAPGTDYRQDVQVAGIRLPQRVDVSDFEKGLFVQTGLAKPTFDPPIDTLRQALKNDAENVIAIFNDNKNADKPSEQLSTLRRRIDSTFTYRSRGARRINNTEKLASDLAKLRKDIAKAQDAGPSGETVKSLEKALTLLRVTMEQSWSDMMRETRQARKESKSLARQLERAQKNRADDETLDALDRCVELLESFCMDPPAYRMILGLGISGFSFRTDEGQTIRHVVPGNRISLLLMPLGKRLSAADPSPNMAGFTVIDDSKTDVASIDSKIVYIPLDTLQLLANMGPEYDSDDPNKMVTAPRVSQIHVTVDESITDEAGLRSVCRKIEQVLAGLSGGGLFAPGSDISVVTWRQLQAKVIEPLERQRTLVVMMFGIMWLVSCALIFVILYTIVVQKTSDIGILKAIGGSNWAVAGIFLVYGAVIGLIGSAVGTVLGWLFIRNINPIEDWLYKVFDFRVWDREVFMFDKIPNQVDWSAARMVVIGAIISGLIGALVPAIRAARMQPVEALRYE